MEVELKVTSLQGKGSKSSSKKRNEVKSSASSKAAGTPQASVPPLQSPAVHSVSYQGSGKGEAACCNLGVVCYFPEPLG